MTDEQIDIEASNLLNGTGKYAKNPKASLRYKELNQKARENAILRLIGLKSQLEQVTAEREKLLDAYNRIPDYLAKEAIKIRYDIDHGGKRPLSWTQTAYRIGGGNTADSLRMCCQRAVKGL